MVFYTLHIIEYLRHELIVCECYFSFGILCVSLSFFYLEGVIENFTFTFFLQKKF